MKIFNKNKINWGLLAKYLSAESSNEESVPAKEWMDSKNKNKILFKNIQSDWEKINSFKNMKKANVDDAWENLKQRILENEPDLMPVAESKRENTARIYLYRTLRIAASILLVIGILYGVYKIYIESYFANNTIVRSGSDNTSKLILPDGSKVYMNSNTFINYQNQFGTGSRKIHLKGEAYFEVIRNSDIPFIVNTNNAVIKVLGTSFNVNTQTSDNKLEVFVESGNVQLSQKSNNENNVIIESGYIGVFSKNSLNKSKNEDLNYLAWKTRYLIFRETTLEIVAKKIESVYNTNIQFENQETAKCKLTATFDNASLDSIIKVIKESFNLQIENIIKTNEKVIIVGRGC